MNGKSTRLTVVENFEGGFGCRSDERLMPREHEVIGCLGKGMVYQEIANALGITLSTVSQHAHHIYSKLGAANKVEALNKGLPADMAGGSNTARKYYENSANIAGVAFFHSSSKRSSAGFHSLR